MVKKFKWIFKQREGEEGKDLGGRGEKKITPRVIKKSSLTTLKKNIPHTPTFTSYLLSFLTFIPPPFCPYFAYTPLSPTLTLYW